MDCATHQWLQDLVAFAAGAILVQSGVRFTYGVSGGRWCRRGVRVEFRHHGWEWNWR